MLKKLQTLITTLGLGSAISLTAQAQISTGYATIVTLPIAVQSGTFTTKINIHNPNLTLPATLDIWYYGADDSATPGEATCGFIQIPARNGINFTLPELCPGLNAGSNFGRLRFSQVDATSLPIAVHARVETAQGNGFGIEGQPIGNFSDTVSTTGGSYIANLRRISAPPGFRSGCFIAALQEPVTVRMRLFRSDGIQLGEDRSYPLSGTQMIRILDVISEVGVLNGDFEGVTAHFDRISAPFGPTYIAFCTVQNNTTFDADFRIAKVVSPSDLRMRKESITGVDALGTPFTLLAQGIKNIHIAYLQHPDWLDCRLQAPGTRINDLEFQLKKPNGDVVAGGAGITEFPRTFLGEKSTVASGINSRWRIEVSPRATATVFPISYSISCRSGNGISSTDLIATAADDF